MSFSQLGETTPRDLRGREHDRVCPRCGRGLQAKTLPFRPELPRHFRQSGERLFFAAEQSREGRLFELR